MLPSAPALPVVHHRRVYAPRMRRHLSDGHIHRWYSPPPDDFDINGYGDEPGAIVSVYLPNRHPTPNSFMTMAAAAVPTTAASAVASPAHPRRAAHRLMLRTPPSSSPSSLPASPLMAGRSSGGGCFERLLLAARRPSPSPPHRSLDATLLDEELVLLDVHEATLVQEAPIRRAAQVRAMAEMVAAARAAGAADDEEPVAVDEEACARLERRLGDEATARMWLDAKERWQYLRWRMQCSLLGGGDVARVWDEGGLAEGERLWPVWRAVRVEEERAKREAAAAAEVARAAQEDALVERVDEGAAAP